MSEPQAYEFSAKDQALIAAGRLELVNVRPLHARIAAVLYDIGSFIWELFSIPGQIVEANRSEFAKWRAERAARRAERRARRSA